MVLTDDVCLYREAPDRSLGAEGWDIRDLLATASARPGRSDEAGVAMLTAFGDSGLVLSYSVFQKALGLLQQVPKEFPLPEISIESDTSVEFNWDEGAQRVVAVTVDEQPRIGFASLINGDSNYGRSVFAEGNREIPAPLRDLLARIYPRRNARAAWSTARA